ncbi:hypothetical protein MMC18_000386 [Xylographa bjoerkii]|nr:hypothetical protein [Xylographa bjoerkii]
MAEALCGPSNPLQNIQKHTGVDRTLQQDRLVFNRPSSQGFRSAPGPSAGHLDAEFQAFQAGHPLGGGFQEQYRFQQPGPIPGPSNEQLSGWASDFQHLNLNHARSTPIPPSQFKHEAPLQRHTPGGWHHEFVQQQSRQLSIQDDTTQLYGGSNFHPQQQYLPFSSVPEASDYLSPIAQQKLQENQLEDVFDEAAFEKAFDTARTEILRTEVQPDGDTLMTEHVQVESLGIEDDLKKWWASDPLLKPRDGTHSHDLSEQLLQSIIVHHKVLLDQSDSENFADSYPNQELKIGSDAILEEVSNLREDNDPTREADELARTAGQLLDNLKDEHSQKFQDSSFLALMRQLRDKEVRVEGDQMVDNTQPLHPGGQYYPEGTNKKLAHPLEGDHFDQERLDLRAQALAVLRQSGITPDLLKQSQIERFQAAGSALRTKFLERFDTNKNMIPISNRLAEREAMLTPAEKIQATFDKSFAQLEGLDFHPHALDSSLSHPESDAPGLNSETSGAGRDLDLFDFEAFLRDPNYNGPESTKLELGRPETDVLQGFDIDNSSPQPSFAGFEFEQPHTRDAAKRSYVNYPVKDDSDKPLNTQDRHAIDMMDHIDFDSFLEDWIEDESVDESIARSSIEKMRRAQKERLLMNEQAREHNNTINRNHRLQDYFYMLMMLEQQVQRRKQRS